MPHKFRYHWTGDDGVSRSKTIVLHDDGGIAFAPTKAQRRMPTGDPAQREAKLAAHRAKLASYAAAEASLFSQGPVSDAVFAARTGPDGCGSCERRRESPRDPIGFCGECGCGTAIRAALTIKGRMPAATCPLDPPRWGAAEGEGAGALDRLKQLGGVAANLIDLVSRGPKRRAKEQHG